MYFCLHCSLITIIFLSLFAGCGTCLRFSPTIPLETRTSTSLKIKFPVLDTASFSGTVVGYEISHRSFLSTDWDIDVNKFGSSGIMQLEQQLITIKVDEHKNLKDNGGSFVLGLVRSGLNPENIEDLSRTPKIEWNSTASQLQKALEYLPAIKIKEVRRCGTLSSDFNAVDGSIDWLNFCPYGLRGGYTWLVVFNVTVSEGNLPLLYPYRNDLKNTWTGIGNQIMINRLSRGMINPNACRDGICTYNATGLQSGTYYSFRVRALISSDGWTDYSKMSEFVPTLDVRAPSRPRPPSVASVTSSTISYRILNAPITDSISTYLTEYKCNHCNSWLSGPIIDISDTTSSRSMEIVFTVNALKPLTSYQARIRAANVVGVSPFSSPSLAISTSYPPESTIIPRTPVAVPGTLSDNQVEVQVSTDMSQLLSYGTLTFIIQYRKLLSGEEDGWINLPNTVFSFRNTTSNVVKQEIEVRADSDVTECKGYFWLTVGDRTDTPVLRDTLSTPLAYDVSADDMKAAISRMVFSGDSKFNDDAYLQVYKTKNKLNGYRWSVEFHGFLSSVPNLQILKSNLSFHYEQPFVSTYTIIDNTNNITYVTTTTYKSLETSCWSGAGAGVLTKSLPSTSSSTSKSSRDNAVAAWTSKRILISGLSEQTSYQIRSITQLEDGSMGGISDILNITTRDSILPQSEPQSSLSLSYASLLYSSIGNGMSVFESGTENIAPRIGDPMYVSGSAMGGLSGESGSNGLCVLSTVFPTLPGVPKDAYYNTKYFFYSKKSQSYTVPYDPSNAGYASAKVVVTVKCWGGGGGGGKVSDLVSAQQGIANLSKGGAGGFAQGSFWLASGEIVEVTVGGGGEASVGETGGAGGLFGGATGGSSSKGGGGGGGGGASAVTYNGNHLLVAGGGGGAGSTDYCCAHGGPGGGKLGGNGSYPGDDTPWPITSSVSPSPVLRRFEYTSSQCPVGIEGEWCVSEWDTRPESLPAEHRHLDYGLASEGNYSAWASSGGGGGQELGGSAGACGSYVLSAFGGSGGGGAVEMGVDERVAIYSLQRGLSVRAGAGRYLEGGVGADGKDSGGGGGGGLWGGGGGGSGIDGAGGGGGSSFVNNSYLAADGVSSTTSATLTVLAIPSTPVIDFMNSSHILLRWTLNSQNTLWGQADRFEVEMSSGPNSEDFLYLDTALPQNSEHVSGLDDSVSSMSQYASLYVTGLQPGTSYSFRVIPHFSSGKGAASAVLSVVSMTSYADAFWEPIWPRRHSLASIGSGLTASALRVSTTGTTGTGTGSSSNSVTSSDERVTDPPTALTPVTPSSRRGHSLSNIYNQIFMFGGRTDGYTCAATYKDFLYLGSPESGREVYPCTRLSREVNEVWVLDLLTYEWYYLNASSSSSTSTTSSYSSSYPLPREQHTAAVVDGNLYIFGGKSSDYSRGKDVVHRDFWRLEVQPQTTLHTSSWDNFTSSTPLLIPEDKRLFVLVNGSANGGTLLNGDGVDARRGMCIRSLTVQVILSHPCASQLRLSLMGPGPHAGSANFQPSSYSNEILLFADSSTNGTRCVPGIHDFTFDDSSTRVTNKCCPSNYTGSYQPLGKLAEFAGLSPSAEWTLVVEDKLKDGNVGSLVMWSIRFVLEPCIRKYSWSNLTSTIWSSSSTSPTARYHASSIVYGKQIFLFNGLGPRDTPLNDLYRFNTLDSSWTKLTAVDFEITSWEYASNIGASFSLTPWGLLRYGGYSRLPEMNDNSSSYSNDVYLWDPHTMRWSWLEVQPCPIVSNFTDKLYPTARYLSAITFIPSGSLDWKSSFSERALFDTPISSSFANYAGGAMLDSLFMFGGFNGASGSINDGSSGGLLNDIWMLRFRNRSTTSYRDTTNKRRNYVCLWRSTSRFFNEQLSGCLGPNNSPCLFNDLVMLAWCAGTNQTVT